MFIITKGGLLMFTDLHLHSYFSDGTSSPEEIVMEAKTKGFDTLAITDHNTFDAYPRFKQACEENQITPIKGMEMDCSYGNLILHVLAYNFRDTKELVKMANHNRQLLLDMSRDLILAMQEDFPNLSLEEYDNWEYDRTKGAWKGIHYFIKKGIIKRPWDGFHLYDMYHCGYHHYPFTPITDVCKAITMAGGTPVLAHPSNWFGKLSHDELWEKLEDLRDCGIKGIECYYPANKPMLTDTCVAFCRNYDFAITCGSDSHGHFLKIVKGVSFEMGKITAPKAKLVLDNIYTATDNRNR